MNSSSDSSMLGGRIRSMVIIIGLIGFLIWNLCLNDNLPYISSLTQTKNETTLKSNPVVHYNVENSKKSNKEEKTAVIHVGPHKTGTTAIQLALRKIPLEEDNYFARTSFPKTRNDVRFATCFLPKTHLSSRRHSCDKSYYDLLKSQWTTGQNVLTTAEAFDYPEIDLESLRNYFKPWDNVNIIVYYRRYYDWLGSYYNQLVAKKVKYSDENMNSIIFHLTDSNWVESKTEQYTTHVIERYRRYFKNITVLNFHESMGVIESFYCQGIQDATNACRTVQMMNTTDYKGRSSLPYKEILIAARKANLVKIGSNSEFKLALEFLEQKSHPELSVENETLICLPPNVLDSMLTKSLEAEKELFPDLFSSPLGEAALRADFEQHSKTNLCGANVTTIINDREWRNFFRDVGKSMRSKGSFFGI